MYELKAECNKRGLEFNSDDSIQDLINLLIKDDNKPTDWGKVYSRVLYHTGMGYDEIGQRSYAQIEAILDGADENISLKMGIPNIFGGTSPPSSTGLADEPPKLGQFAAMAGAFGGI